MHPIKLLSIFLRCNGFARIQKSVVNQTSSGPPNSDHDPFIRCKIGFGKSFGASSQSNHWTGKWCTFHHTSQSDWEMVGRCFIEFTLNKRTWHFKTTIFWFAVDSWGTHLSSFFTFPSFQIFQILLSNSQIWSIYFKCWRIVEWSLWIEEVEFVDSFSCSCKRISFDDHLSWSLSTSSGRSLHSSSSSFYTSTWLVPWFRMRLAFELVDSAKYIALLNVGICTHSFICISLVLFLWRTLTNTVGLGKSLTIFPTPPFYQWRK